MAMGTGMKNWKAFKVVNYSEWCNIPELFTNIDDAKEAREKWEYKEGSVIEQVGPKMRKAKMILK